MTLKVASGPYCFGALFSPTALSGSLNFYTSPAEVMDSSPKITILGTLKCAMLGTTVIDDVLLCDYAGQLSFKHIKAQGASLPSDRRL